ncbi:MAG: Uma2 family endonuclease [Cyanobacteria bacterium P01_H01_bin.121]
MIATPQTFSLLELPAGATLTLPMSWSEFEQILRERGNRSLPRLKYSHGVVIAKMPGLQHGQLDQLINHLIEQLFIQTDRDYAASSPVTLKLPQQSGLEPDHCYWVRDWEVISGKTQIDLTVDPIPDIAVEVDISSYSDPSDYLPLQVPEVWIIKNNQLVVYALTDAGYTAVPQSQFFESDVTATFERAATLIQQGMSLFRAVKQAIQS